MKRKKIVLYLLTAAMVTSMLPCNLAETIRVKNDMRVVNAAENTTQEKDDTEEDVVYEEIAIGTVEELKELAEKCHDDAWSANKYIRLTQDINLTGSGFSYIPVFNGYFDGNGHTIEGYSYAQDGYDIGFFRYIGENAIVNDLTIRGNVTGADEKQCIGGFCGVNRGTIRNCVFQGMVSGKTETGGIAGINESTGVIQLCTMKGRVSGYYYTGGIAGKNYGMINNCTNYANINDSGEWVEQDDENSLDIFQDISANSLNVKLQSGVDTGGIAGYSKGTVTRCSNHGIIGYERTGYNIGGIVGRQSGVVSFCTNKGTVYGRKDIGGIVGQIEPYIELDEAESVRSEVNRLHEMVEKTLDDMETSKNVLKSDMDTLRMYSDSVLDTGDSIADTMTDFIDTNLNTTNAASDRVDNVIDRLPAIMDNAAAAGNSMSEVNKILSQLNSDLNITGKLSSGQYNEADYSRISLNSGVGGVLSASSMNPQEGSTVTVTVKENNGYTLKNLTVTDAYGNNITTSYVEYGKFTFVMPRENVVVTADFFYSGAFLASSSAGGKVSVVNNQDGTTLTISVEAQEGYSEPTQVFLNGTTPVALSGGKVTITKTDYRSGYENVPVYAEFTRNGSSSFWTPAGSTPYNVKAAASTGGSVIPNQSTAGAGDTVYVACTTDKGYRMKTFAVKTLNGGAEIPFVKENGRYSFTMPNEDVLVESTFEPIQLALLSNAGGSAGYTEKDGVISLSVSPNQGYTLSGNPVIKDCNGADVALTSASANTYTYEFRLSPVQEPATASLTFTKQNQSGAADAAVDRINQNVSLLNEQIGNISAKSDEVRNDLLDSNGNFDENRLKDAETWNDIMDLAEYTADAAETSSQIVSDLTLLANLYAPYASDAMKAANKDVENALNKIGSVTDSLKAANTGVRGIVDYLNAQAKLEFKQLGEEFSQKVDVIHDQLKGMSDCVGKLTDHASGYSDVINDDLRAVNDQINVVFNLFLDRVESISEDDKNVFYEDVSDEEIEEATTGLVDNCINKGVVKGDIDVGGIAGSMAIDEEDPEENAAGNIDKVIGSSYTALCIIKDCNNQGFVTAKKDGAGGIVGYMRQGIVTRSIAEGLVESTDGDYVGGICGESLTIIRACYALCTISGSKNVGGIAGYGSTITDCYSLVNIKDAESRYGAIAGQLAQGVEDEGEKSDNVKVGNNYYVSNKAYAVDNISYEGVAEAMTYEELLQVEGLPTNFAHLKVTFKVDDMYLGSQELAYGESLSKVNLPEIPAKDGYYGKWPDVSSLVMTENMVIEGEYQENVTVLESREKDENGKAIALLEDVFTRQAVLHAEKSDKVPDDEMAGKGKKCSFDITLENSQKTNVDKLALRILNPYEDEATVWGCRDGIWYPVASKVRGQYIQIDMTGTYGTFCIVSEKTSAKKIVLVVVAIVAAVGVILVLIKLLKKHKNKPKQEKVKKVNKKNKKKDKKDK